MFGEPANEKAYETAVFNGLLELQQSYDKDASAREISTSASAICERDKDHASGAKLKQLNDEKRKLTKKAEGLADNALKWFRSAEALIPERPEAIFGEGLALLQLKDYCSSIEKIEWVREANYEPPGEPAETTFALGAAFVGSSDVGSKGLEVGIHLLQEYITKAKASANPKDEFPNLQAANRLKDAKTHDKLKDEDQKKNKEPNFASCPLPIPGKTALPFTVSISSAIGYNDNVISLGRRQPLPLGTAHKGSVYNESSFGLGRDFSLSHPSSLSETGWLSDRLSLTYLFIADTYAELPELDTLLNTVFGSYQRAFTPHVGGLLKLSDQWLYIDQSLGSNLVTAQEALVIDLNARLKTLLSYYLIRTDGFTAAMPSNNPDGFTHRQNLRNLG